ncbi:MAG TPA: rRNA maturation RNase YbeY [Candidatus Acidoferrales bacterium]|nr:rRNA maturation RNase YbeY [Candidatus Acidoferrales bacterium]
MILNRQRGISIPSASLSRFLSRIRSELKLGRRDVTICFVKEAEMAELNQTFRGKPKATDVLSFPAYSAEEDGAKRKVARDLRHAANYLGDIAISPTVARANARRYGRDLDDELRILMVHGVLHLLGYDHEADHGEMDRVEARVRRRLGLA